MRNVAVVAVVLAFNSLPSNSIHSLNGLIDERTSVQIRTFKVPSRSALITFSGLWNGVDPYSNYSVLHRPIPSTYQPLLKAEPFTKPVDGGDFGIRIGWDTAQCSNHGLNGSVRDHTRDAVSSGKDSNRELGGGVMFALGPCSVTFSKPVQIPSLFWTFYEPAKQPVADYGTIAVYSNVFDTKPLKSIEVPYRDDKGFVWKELTAFAGLNISKIVFNPRGQNTGLNIDDITIRSVDGQ